MGIKNYRFLTPEANSFVHNLIVKAICSECTDFCLQLRFSVKGKTTLTKPFTFWKWKLILKKNHILKMKACFWKSKKKLILFFVSVLYAEKTKKRVFVQKLWELARIVDVLMNVLLMRIVLERKNVVSMIAVENLAYQVIFFSNFSCMFLNPCNFFQFEF